jgi:hypothetical protein
MEDTPLGSDLDAGATSDAHPCAAGGNACSTAAPAWKSSGTNQRLSSHVQNTSSGSPQHTHTAEKGQKEILCLRLLITHMSTQQEEGVRKKMDKAERVGEAQRKKGNGTGISGVCGKPQ